MTRNRKITWIALAAILMIAAYGPRGSTRRVSYVLDVNGRGAGLPTVVPGQNVVSWINEVNTICTGEIEEP